MNYTFKNALKKLDRIEECLKNKGNLLQEGSDKIKQLEEQLLDSKKTIQTLQLKNEKLSENYKKLIQFLADARQLVVHLQTDLQATQQDKIHIQQELNNTLAILNKPTAEMGTQTDLTAEQINQMENDLAEKNAKIAELNKDRNELTNQITQKENEFSQLKEQAKDLEELNETEKQLIMVYVSGEREKQLSETQDDGTNLGWEDVVSILQDELETGNAPNKKWDWSQLRGVYKDIYSSLKEQLGITKRILNNETKLNRLMIEKNTLQTKYDMEVRSKEELQELLETYRNLGIIIPTSASWHSSAKKPNYKEWIAKVQKLVNNRTNSFFQPTIVFARWCYDRNLEIEKDISKKPILDLSSICDNIIFTCEQNSSHEVKQGENYVDFRIKIKKHSTVRPYPYENAVPKFPWICGSWFIQSRYFLNDWIVE